MQGLVELEEAVRADAGAERCEYVFRLPIWVEEVLTSMIEDKRDVPVAFLLVNILLTAVPAAACVAFFKSHLLGLSYVICNYSFFLQRYLVALLHVTEHKRIFTKDWFALNSLISVFLAPLYGLPCGMYKVHHKIMHHVEGNQSLDTSSTQQYKRDSLLHFLRYWCNHIFGAWVRVPLYAAKKRRYALLVECLAGEGLYLGASWLLVCYNPVAAVWIILVPFLVTSLAIMFGNWSQHIFVDPEQPGNVYRLAYNCVGCPDNQLTFNDGYHILHHVNSQLHWSELPDRLLATSAQHAAHQAFVFRGIGFFDVGLMVMTGRLQQLADHLLVFGGELATLNRSELVEVMKRRLEPVKFPSRPPAALSEHKSENSSEPGS